MLWEISILTTKGRLLWEPLAQTPLLLNPTWEGEKERVGAGLGPMGSPGAPAQLLMRKTGGTFSSEANQTSEPKDCK